VHELLSQARALLPQTVALRRAIHHQPEIGLDLPLTQAKVLESLRDLPLQVRTGHKTTSVIADLVGQGGPGKTIILRGDMDALPLHEDTGLPFASEFPGRMHACGHDGHTAMLATAARLLAERRSELAGTVRFMFQPGEEGHRGAVVMLEEGLLEADPPPSAAFALHATPRWAAGTVTTRPGPVLASSDAFQITVTGKGGHASAPHLAADPVPVACEIVTALQTFVTRSVSVFEPGVVTVGRITAGTTHNIIPETATLVGTVRTVSPGTRQHIVSHLGRLAEGIAQAHGLRAETTLDAGYPVTVNDAQFAGFVLDVARGLLGAEQAPEQATPQMAAEDFSYVLERVPGAMVSLGTRPNGLAEGDAPAGHSNRYLLEEDALPVGSALYAAVALRYLSSPRSA
jgi:hippurate hydrolase